MTARYPAAILTAACLVAGAVATHPGALRAQDAPSLQAANAGAPVHAYHIRENVYLVVDAKGTGPNMVVQAGDEGVLVVDTGPAGPAQDALRAIRRISTKPIRYVINTSNREEHIGGNLVIAGAGRGYEGVTSLNQSARATGIAHENLLKRMSGLGEASPLPAGAWPTLAFHNDRKEIHFNGEPVQVLHQPNAQADSDSIVFFRGSDVIAAGDIYLTTTYPIIDVARGGTIDGVINGLNNLIDLTVTYRNQEGGTLVVSGHGRVSDEADVVEYRDMLTIVRERVAHFVKQGMTLEQIRKAQPGIDFDSRYGAPSGPASPSEFIGIVYRGVVDAAKRTRS